MAFCPQCQKKLDAGELRRNVCDQCGTNLSAVAKPVMGRGTLVPGSFAEPDDGGPFGTPTPGPAGGGSSNPVGSGSGRQIGTGTLVPPPAGSESGASSVEEFAGGRTVTGPMEDGTGKEAGTASDPNTGTIVGGIEDDSSGTHVEAAVAPANDANQTYMEPAQDAGATYFEPADEPDAGGRTIVDADLVPGGAAPAVAENDRTIVGGFDEPVPMRDYEGDRTITASELLDDENIGRTINVADLPPDEQAEMLRTISDPGMGESFGVVAGGATIMDADLMGDSQVGKGSQRIVVQGGGAETNLVLHTRAFLGGNLDPDDTNVRPDYEIIKELGKGGMGVVYEARQTSIDRAVALKLLKDQLAFDKWQRESFLSEAVVTGDLDHPNIVPIYDVGRNSKNALFYAMKKVVGTPWHKVVRKKPLHENLDILLKCCDAVAFAHSRGVVHRDLKPENVMLGDFGEVLVMDWGLAITTKQFLKGDMITQTTSMGGSPAYMAPELATGPLDKIRPWSDVYLLGAMLYEIVTGTPPHAGRSVSECLRAARENIIAPTNKSGELVEIALKAMASRPQDRYADVKALQTAIREYLSHLESLGLSERASRELETARKTDDYREYARAVFAYEEAINLWSGNSDARDGLVGARLGYAESALRKGDYDLGLSLLDAGESRHTETIQRLTSAQKERSQRSNLIKSLWRVAAGLLIAIFVGGSTGSYLIYREKLRADENAQIAKTNEETAKKNEAEAKRQEGIALVNFEEARKQELLAKQSEQEAKRQEMVAKQNAEEALRQEAIAKEQEAIAKTNADEAIKQAKIAEENALLAEWEGFQSELRRDQAVKAQAAERVQRTRAEIARNDALYEGYVSQIGLAASKTDAAAFDAAREILAQLAPAEFAGFRGWEYDRLKYLCEQAQAVVAIGPQLSASTISRQGNLWVVGGRDGKVRMISLPDLKVVGEVVHGHAVTSVAVDPAGKRLATAGDNTTIRVWDVATRELVGELTGHEDHVLSVEFSAKGDELVSTSYDTTARVWDVKGGAAKQVLRGHSWYVRGSAWSPDGATLLTAGDDRQVIVWKRNAEGKFLKKDPAFLGHEASVTAVALSNDGMWAASGDELGRVWVWRPADLGTGSEGARKELTAQGHTRSIHSVSFAPDSSGLLLTASGDNTAKVWDVAQGRPVVTLRGHGNVVQSGRLSPAGEAGRSAYTVGYDGKAIRWDLAAYAEFKVLVPGSAEQVLKQHDDEVLAVAFDGTGKRVVTASRDQTAVVWDAATGGVVSRLEEGHAFGAVSSVWLPKAKLLVTAALDQTGRVWDVARGSEVARLSGIGTTAVLAVSADEKWLATGDDANNVLVWDLADLLAKPKAQSKPIAFLDLQGDSATVTSAGFHPEGTMLAVGTSQGEIELWSLAAAAVADGPEAGKLATSRVGVLAHGLEDDQVTACQFIQEGKELLSAGFSGTVLRWSLATKETVGSRFELERAVRGLAVSADGTQFLTVRETNSVEDASPQVQVWDVNRPEKALRGFAVRATDGVVRSASWTEDGAVFTVAANTNRAAQFWSATTGERLADRSFEALETARPEFGSVLGDARVVTLRGGEARVWNVSKKALETTLAAHQAVPAVALSDDGTVVATGSLDGSIKIWDAATGRSLAKLTGAHPRGVRSVGFLPGTNDRLVSAGDDPVARVWNLKAEGDQKLERELKGHVGRLSRATLSVDGSRLLTTADDGACRVWDLKTGESLVEFKGHTGPVIGGDLSSDGLWAVTADEASVWVWDVATGKALISEPIQGHGGDLTDVRFAPVREVEVPGPDGQPVKRLIYRVLTASLDGTSKLWDVATDGETGARVGKELMTLSRPMEGDASKVRPGVTAVAMDRTGRVVVTGDRSGSAILWMTGSP